MLSATRWALIRLPNVTGLLPCVTAAASGNREYEYVDAIREAVVRYR